MIITLVRLFLLGTDHVTYSEYIATQLENGETDFAVYPPTHFKNAEFAERHEKLSPAGISEREKTSFVCIISPL